jgi:hypothetical protein
MVILMVMVFRAHKIANSGQWTAKTDSRHA